MSPVPDAVHAAAPFSKVTLGCAKHRPVGHFLCFLIRSTFSPDCQLLVVALEFAQRRLPAWGL